MEAEKRSGNVTQADIARELNISVVSVSNALNGRKGVCDELRQRVLNAADEMGYRQSKTQGEGKRGLIRVGVLIAQEYMENMDSYYMNMYEKMKICAAERKLLISAEILDEDIKKVNLTRLVKNGRLRGLLVLGELSREDTEILWKTSPVPIIFVDYYTDLQGANFVIRDGYIGMCWITRMLIDAGYRDIAFVGNPAASSNIMDRYMGYRKAMMEENLEITQDRLIKDRQYCHDVPSFQLPRELPEAFVCCCNRTAEVVLEQLSQRGYSVPEDVAVTGYNYFGGANVRGIELTSYEIKIETLAQISVNTMIRKIRNAQLDNRVRVVLGDIVQGNSYMKDWNKQVKRHE